MCAPLAPILAVASAATTMAGQFMQGQGAYTQAKYEEAAAKSNQALAAQQAKDSIILTGQEAARRYREASQLQGQQQAAMAANGIDINYGSAVDTQRDTAMITAEDVGNIYTGGERRTEGYLTDAYNYRMMAAAARSTAKAVPIATGLNMLGTALGTASQINKMKAQGFG